MTSQPRALCDPETPDWNAGLQIDTTITLVDPEGLGACVAELASPQQAAFLIGLTEAFAQFPPPGHRELQCAYIADEFRNHPGVAASVAALLDILAVHIRAVI